MMELQGGTVAKSAIVHHDGDTWDWRHADRVCSAHGQCILEYVESLTTQGQRDAYSDCIHAADLLAWLGY